jgi:class 3 adenylate cyclase/tetratricopeptide (TPR) repeat protein
VPVVDKTAPILGYFSKLALDQAFLAGNRERVAQIEGSFLFADLSGFTAMSDKLGSLGRLGAEELAAIINGVFDPLLGILRSHGGDVVKFGGDAFLAMFCGGGSMGAAAACGLALIDRLSSSDRVKSGAGEFPIAIHAGLSSGRGLSAIVGGRGARLDHLICGPDISRAYAAAEAAGPGEIFISGETDMTAGIEYESVDSKPPFVRLTGAPEIELRKDDDVSPPEIDPEHLNQFLPSVLWEKMTTSTTGRVEGEHRPITAMFIGVDGWHKNLSSPGNTFDSINRHIAGIFEITEKYGGNVVRIDPSVVGERALVLFGAPVMRENAPRDALEAALDLIELTAEISGSLPENLRIRIGVNSGPAYVGDVGGSHRREYTAMGKEINLAARLMDEAEWGGIIAGRSTLEACDGKFDIEQKHTVRLKGIEKPIRLESVKGRAAAGVVSRKSKTLVGREKEILEIEKFVSRSAAGKGSLMMISGEAGSGKSVLVEKAILELRRKRVIVFQAACFQHMANIPLYPLGEILCGLLGIGRDDQLEIRKKKLRAALDDSGAAYWEGLVSRLAGYTVKDTPEIRHLSETVRRNRTFQLLFDLLVTLNRERSACIVIDDLHWSDASTLEFLNRYAGHSAGTGIDWLLAFRPDPQIPRYESSMNIDLGPLDGGSSARLFESIAGEAIPNDILADVVKTSGGNPFYLEEIARAARDVGVTEWTKTRDIPDSIERVITARLDRLDEAVKATIRTASVIGRVFEVQDLESIFPIDNEKGRLREYLERSAELDITPLRQREPAVEYEFKHIMTRDVAYSGLSFGARRKLHSSLARRYRIARRERGIGLELIGHHYENSEDRVMAVPYYLAAGLAAARSYSNSEAVHYLGKVIEILGPEGNRRMACRAALGLGRILKLTGDYRGAESRLRNVIAVLPDGKFWKKRAFKELSELYRVETDFENAKKALFELLETDRDDPDTGAVFQNGMGEIDRRRGELESALGHFREAAGCRGRIKAANLAQILNNMGITLWMTGRLDEALGCYREAEEIYGQGRNLQGTAKILNNSAIIFEQKGDLLSAAERYGRAAEVFEKIGDIRSFGFCLGNLATNCITRGLPGKAREYADKALGLFRRIDDRNSYALTLGNLVDWHYLTGDYEASAETYKKAMNLAGELANEELVCEMEIRQAKLLAASHTGKALSLMGSALEKSGRKKWRDLELKAEFHMLEIETLYSRAGITQAELGGLERLLRKDLTPELACAAMKIKGLLLFGSGNFRGAGAALMAAYKMARRSDLALDMWEILSIYGSLWKDCAEAAAGRTIALQSRILDGLEERASKLMKSAMTRRIELYISKSGSQLAGRKHQKEFHRK